MLPQASIGALARASGVNVETIRFYEKAGVMPAPPRSASGYRLYGEEHLKRLTFVRRGRELGFSLDEVRELLGLVDRSGYTCAQVRGLMLAHVEAIGRKIADLRRLRQVMADVAAECTGEEAPQCPIIDALCRREPLTVSERGRGPDPGAPQSPRSSRRAAPSRGPRR
jgi:MerR family mercuric resistance operon transcriptional regulator